MDICLKKRDDSLGPALNSGKWHAEESSLHKNWIYRLSTNLVHQDLVAYPLSYLGNLYAIYHKSLTCVFRPFWGSGSPCPFTHHHLRAFPFPAGVWSLEIAIPKSIPKQKTPHKNRWIFGFWVQVTQGWSSGPLVKVSSITMGPWASP